MSVNFYPQQLQRLFKITHEKMVLVAGMEIMHVLSYIDFLSPRYFYHHCVSTVSL